MCFKNKILCENSVFFVLKLLCVTVYWLTPGMPRETSRA